MKKHVLRSLMIGSLAAAFASVAAYGQQAYLGINIPFEFTAGQTTFPAGQYTLAPALTSNTRAALLIRRTKGGPQAAICSTMAVASRDAQEKSKLVFHRYGQRYFLYQVWRAGDNQGHEVMTSRIERELAQNGLKPQLAVITIEKSAVAAGKSRATGRNGPSD